jgi:hypothetical protein
MGRALPVRCETAGENEKLPLTRIQKSGTIAALMEQHT